MGEFVLFNGAAKFIGKGFVLTKKVSSQMGFGTRSFTVKTIDLFGNRFKQSYTPLFLLIFLFVSLYVHTNAVILILFLFIYEFLSTLPIFLNKRVVYAIISLKFASNGLSCFLYPNLFMPAESYAFTSLCSIVMLALKETVLEERSFLLMLNQFLKEIEAPCLTESQVFTWKTWLGVLSSPALKKIGLIGSAGGGIGSAFYLFNENNRKSYETQMRVITEQSKLIQDDSHHTILLKNEGAISHAEANFTLRANKEELARLKLEAANIKTLADVPGAVIEKFLP
jgi:hypothetical protein